eukprot:303708_1
MASWVIFILLHLTNAQQLQRQSTVNALTTTSNSVTISHDAASATISDSSYNISVASQNAYDLLLSMQPKWGFKDTVTTTLDVTIYGETPNPESDTDFLTIFSVGNTQFFSFFIHLDTDVIATKVYPLTTLGTKPSLSSWMADELIHEDRWDRMSNGGDNWKSTDPRFKQQGLWPLRFEIINDPILDTCQFKFYNQGFDYVAGNVFNVSFNALQPVDVYIMGDTTGEQFVIHSVNVEQYHVNGIPTILPTSSPVLTNNPTQVPSISPSNSPTVEPTVEPTMVPTMEPSETTAIPTTSAPSSSPTIEPTFILTIQPIVEPSQPTAIPTTSAPSSTPTVEPTANPTAQPTMEPSEPTPSRSPTVEPTVEPTTNTHTSRSPTVEPTINPTLHSSTPTNNPTSIPSSNPTVQPSEPTMNPTKMHTKQPTLKPEKSPTQYPTSNPSQIPSIYPTTSSETMEPTFIKNNLHFVCVYSDSKDDVIVSTTLKDYAHFMTDLILSSLQTVTLQAVQYEDSINNGLTAWQRAGIIDFTICSVFDIEISTIGIECPNYSVSEDSSDSKDVYVSVGIFGIVADAALSEYKQWIINQMQSVSFKNEFTENMNERMDNMGMVEGSRRMLLKYNGFRVIDISVIDPNDTLLLSTLVTLPDDDDLSRNDTSANTIVVVVICLCVFIAIFALAMYYRKVRPKEQDKDVEGMVEDNGIEMREEYEVEIEGRNDRDIVNAINQTACAEIPHHNDDNDIVDAINKTPGMPRNDENDIVETVNETHTMNYYE